MKQCTRCQETKPLDPGFYRNKRSKDGYLTVCRACINAQQRDYVAKNKERVRNGMKAYNKKNREQIRVRQREYRDANREYLKAYKREKDTGFSADLFNKTYEYQGGKCAICKCDLAALRPDLVHADHCHGTRIPRGILCSNCNTAIGQLGDTADALQRAVDYLTRPPVVKMLDV